LDPTVDLVVGVQQREFSGTISDNKTKMPFAGFPLKNLLNALDNSGIALSPKVPM
jgi:hypothetical protein